MTGVQSQEGPVRGAGGSDDGRVPSLLVREGLTGRYLGVEVREGGTLVLVPPPD